MPNLDSSFNSTSFVPIKPNSYAIKIQNPSFTNFEEKKATHSLDNLNKRTKNERHNHSIFSLQNRRSKIKEPTQRKRQNINSKIFFLNIPQVYSIICVILIICIHPYQSKSFRSLAIELKQAGIFTGFESAQLTLTIFSWILLESVIFLSFIFISFPCIPTLVLK
jgi:hypothetical protein